MPPNKLKSGVGEIVVQSTMRLPDDDICARLAPSPAHRAETKIHHCRTIVTTEPSKSDGKKRGSQSMSLVTSFRNPGLKARGLIFVAAMAASQVHAADEPSFDDFPFMVHCSFSGLSRAFYLSTIGSDGVAIYISPDRQAGTITIKGKAEPVGADGSGDCGGKTLEQLRSAGQSYYLAR